MPRPGSFGHDAVHHILLSAGIWIVEGLDLSRVPPSPCDLICLPLPLVDADGAPARAVVRPQTSWAETAGGSKAGCIPSRSSSSW